MLGPILFLVFINDVPDGIRSKVHVRLFADDTAVYLAVSNLEDAKQLQEDLDRSGIRLQGDWGEIVALEGSKSPWEALRVTKTSPLIFATFEKANTCAKRTFC